MPSVPISNHVEVMLLFVMLTFKVEVPSWRSLWLWLWFVGCIVANTIPRDKQKDKEPKPKTPDDDDEID